MRTRFCTAVIATLLVSLGALPCRAQWVLAAHAAKNMIQRMSQKSAAGGYDVAIVLLEAPADKVYERTLASLKTHSELTITKDDSKRGQIEFRKGNEVAGFNIGSLGDKLTQLVIASNVTDPTQPGATPMVVNAVLRVCKEVNVECSVEQ
jgi:hypothetical protein